MKIHVLPNPHRTTTSVYADADPFAIIVHKYIHNLKHKYEFIHYGLEGSDVDCEHHSLPKNLEEFNREASKLIAERKSPGDIILCFYGTDNRDATIDHQDLKIVEPVIGYTPGAIFAPFRVFESYSHMAYYYGTRDMLMSPSWWDAVIPSGKNPNDFIYNEQKDDYFLCFGRVTKEKGIDLAIQATDRAGVRLVIAGPGDLKSMGYNKIPKHVTFTGVCDVEKRKFLMKNAMGIIGPTHFLEPFGNMVVEGYFSGTPAITSDWGAFTETVVQGKTGYRCRLFRDFVEAIDKVKSNAINPKDCYDYAMKNYTHDVVYDKHDKYLQRLIMGDYYG